MAWVDDDVAARMRMYCNYVCAKVRSQARGWRKARSIIDPQRNVTCIGGLGIATHPLFFYPEPPPQQSTHPHLPFQNMPFILENVVRPNILALKPYRCARDDYSEGILLDANENAYGPSLPSSEGGSLNRYPDPTQRLVKEKLVALRSLRGAENLFLGVGSDEVIDLLIRIFCVPAKDSVLITPPTYGMYTVSAQINDVKVSKVNLDVEEGRFQIKPEEINARLASDPSIKLVFLCSPGNPTGTVLSHASIRAILENPSYAGVVAVDEAYVDFVADDCDGSVANWIDKYPNLVVMQTLRDYAGWATRF
ncbi:pyridoxal phosphate-dependent transferase [Jimgerdemannia flammicorona]|uniref:histidinol-phosphate transaminase n=1 Tax=Jimgerdemannia flammicorona TaxID=994334 RepID=A0A433QTP6_9FUNG|nr:pyridoxal phosphate-dependent transferase [Jimgerdemannia flammicorona]